jgi:hypothetical protein
VRGCFKQSAVPASNPLTPVDPAHRLQAGSSATDAQRRREIIMWIRYLVAAALWGMAGIAGAVGQLADVIVFDRAESRNLPVYQHEGRHYVVGHPGREYQVRVRNRTGGEILAVVSVDGVNVVTGETAGWEQSGYVFSPYQSYDIRGWRKSMRRIAAFFFTEHENSYATRTGRPNDVGVIGVAVFHKKHEPAARIDRPSPRPFLGRDAPRGAPAEGAAAMGELPPSQARSADAAAAEAPAKSAGTFSSTPGARGFDDQPLAPHSAPYSQSRSTTLGTGHGRSEASHVTYTRFERASTRPAEVITLHYDTYANLVSLGVIREPRYARPYPSPAPFPGQFVPDPR